MADINRVFTSNLLRSVHAEVAKMFPEIASLRHAAGVTRSMRGQYFVQIVTPSRAMFNFDCRAFNADEARCKAWHAFMRKYSPRSAAHG